MSAVMNAALRAVTEIVESRSIPIDVAPRTAGGYAISQAAEVVAGEMKPILEHVTNQEPWYQSRVTWGAIVASLSPLLGLIFGSAITAEQQGDLVQVAATVGTLVGAGLTLSGRWVATRPIGG